MKRLAVILLAITVAVSGCTISDSVDQPRNDSSSRDVVAADVDTDDGVIKRSMIEEDGVVCYVYAEEPDSSGLRPKAGGISCLPVKGGSQ